MDTSLLNPKIQDFINANIGLNVTDLALQKNPFTNENWISILNQIAAKTKAKDKLPTWFETANIIYPSKISVEQTSSEKTALYKSNLVSGESLIDLTGGFGIDDFYFSKKINQVIHCEIDAQLSEIVAHNFKVLGANNIQCFSNDSAVILKERKQKFDWIYIDPSRRNDWKGKVFMLNDCLPNVPENLDFYFTFSNKIVIKTAPILDLSAGLLELKHVKNIHIVAVENEVKELLWEIEKDFIGTISIKTINIGKENNEVFEFTLDKNQSNAHFGLPKKYLYEPNAAIMKSGGFDAVTTAFEVTKLHQHSHLYTSDSLSGFPGRKFEILNSFSYQKATMKKFLEHSKINITVRNFPDSVENIRKKWKIKEGGNHYCFFTTNANNDKIVLICAKINH